MQNNNTNNFYGNVTGVQIQQGTSYSTQKQTINQGVDYKQVEEIINQIKKYESILDSDFGNKASELRRMVSELETLVEKKNNPTKIKLVLNDIKNLSLELSGSLIASGILSLLGGVI